MGAPKQRWTEAEESALKTGIQKYGEGKWSQILKDPEFSHALSLRSNVDLKDKWRNISVMASGFGSREKARSTLKKRRLSLNEEDSTELCAEDEGACNAIIDAKPLSVSSNPLQATGRQKSFKRLDGYILEAVTHLMEHLDCNESNIAIYIQDHFRPPSNFQGDLSARLQSLTLSGKLTEVKGNYRKPGPPVPEERALPLETAQNRPPVEVKNDIKPLSKPQINAELAAMRGLTAEMIAAAVAQAVAEAEVKAAEAAEAARVAEAREADAEASQAIVEALLQEYGDRIAANPMLRA